MKTLAFVLAGVAAGIFSGSLGVGGALLATPLIRFLGVPPYLAVGTTVPAILPTTVTGAWSYGRAGLLDLRTAAWAAAAAG
ncbi:MAG: TSUP family transporter, partial [Acidimicrobiales bacterium]